MTNVIMIDFETDNWFFNGAWRSIPMASASRRRNARLKPLVAGNKP